MAFVQGPLFLWLPPKLISFSLRLCDVDMQWTEKQMFEQCLLVPTLFSELLFFFFL